jgi:hypothetical protein
MSQAVTVSVTVGGLSVSLERAFGGGVSALEAFEEAVEALRVHIPRTEFVDESSGSEAGTSSGPRLRRAAGDPPPARPSEGGRPGWAERLAFASASGTCAGARLAGRRRRRPADIGVGLCKVVYVLLRDRDGIRPLGGSREFSRWSDIRGLVEEELFEGSRQRTVLSDRAVFQGWPSRAEAKAYAEAAAQEA